MSRYTCPKCRLCRREGVQLFLKGARCQSQKCALLRRQQAPGQHGTSRRPLSPFGLQLREKQKAKRIYGVLERQFRRYYKEAEKHGGEAGEYLLQLLERRLDNVVFRLGVAHSRSHARQMVTQKKVKLNGRLVDIPSIRVNVGDVIAFVEGGTGLRSQRGEGIPAWLKWDEKKKQAKVLRLPSREEIQEPVEEHLLVEYYSR